MHDSARLEGWFATWKSPIVSEAVEGAGDGHARYVCSRLALYAQSIAPNTEHQVRNHHGKHYPTTGNCPVCCRPGRSCDFYKRVLGLGPDVGTTAEKENQKGFRPLQIPGGQVLLLFPKGSATTTAVLPGGTIPPHDGNGRLHLAFAISAAEVDAWRERLQSHGVSIEGEMEWPRGGTSLYFFDPH